MGEPISEERLRNTRAWAAARPDMSGSAVIVGAIDELLEWRDRGLPTHPGSVWADRILQYTQPLVAHEAATLLIGTEVRSALLEGKQMVCVQQIQGRAEDEQHPRQTPRVIDNVTDLYVFASNGIVNTCKRGEANTTQTRHTAEVELAVGQRMIVERGQDVLRLEVLP